MSGSRFLIALGRQEIDVLSVLRSCCFRYCLWSNPFGGMNRDATDLTLYLYYYTNLVVTPQNHGVLLHSVQGG